jgi:microcystin-dependent protein
MSKRRISIKPIPERTKIVKKPIRKIPRKIPIPDVSNDDDDNDTASSSSSGTSSGSTSGSSSTSTQSSSTSNSDDMPFIGEVKLFGGNFAPRGWALCDGQLLPISQYSALFSILGTIYGGDGRTTFALPDLRGRVPLHPGNGIGLTPRDIGDKFGEEHVTLTEQQLPPHNHSNPSIYKAEEAVDASFQVASSDSFVSGKTPSGQELALDSSSNSGGGQSINNMQPSLGVNYIICLEGIYPSRS